MDHVVVERELLGLKLNGTASQPSSFLALLSSLKNGDSNSFSVITITWETLGSGVCHRVHAQQMLARVINMNNLICRSIPLVSYQIPSVLQGPNCVSYNLMDPSGVTKGPGLRHSRLKSWNRLRQVLSY